MIERKEIEGIPGYHIDVGGVAWSRRPKNGRGGLRHPRKLVTRRDSKGGYPSVTMAGKRRSIHRLLGEAFILNPGNKPLVLHKNGDPNNYTLDNLYWGTHKDNAQDAIKHGTFQGLHNLGERNGRSKYNPKQKRLWKMLVNEFEWRQSQVTSLFEVSPAYLCQLLNGYPIN